MGSSFLGEPNMGNGRVANGGSRKSKKSGSEKPKQPQRGLGVAQLEKIRLHGMGGGCSSYGQFSPYPGSAFSQEDLRDQSAYSSISSSSFSYGPSSAPYSLNPNFVMGMGSGDYERGGIRYVDSNHSSTHMSWRTDHDFLEMPQYTQPAMTGHPLNLRVQDPINENHKKHGSSSLGFEMSDAQELDLELRLSL